LRSLEERRLITSQFFTISKQKLPVRSPPPFGHFPPIWCEWQEATNLHHSDAYKGMSAHVESSHSRFLRRLGSCAPFCRSLLRIWSEPEPSHLFILGGYDCEAAAPLAVIFLSSIEEIAPLAVAAYL